jgi:hypothetical protein
VCNIVRSVITETRLTMTSTTSRKRAEIPVYSFAKHQRLDRTTSIYSPHVLVLEGIFALYDPRVLQLLDMGVRSICSGSENQGNTPNTYTRSTAKLMPIPACRDGVSFQVHIVSPMSHTDMWNSRS